MSHAPSRGPSHALSHGLSCHPRRPGTSWHRIGPAATARIEALARIATTVHLIAPTRRTVRKAWSVPNGRPAPSSVTARTVGRAPNVATAQNVVDVAATADALGTTVASAVRIGVGNALPCHLANARNR